MRAREYAGPLGVVAAGVIGFGLLCSVSGLAMSDLSRRPHMGVEPLNIVDLAVANLSTSAALTQQAVTAFVSTPTSGPTDPASLTPEFIPSDTSTVVPVAATATQPTRTRRSRPSIPAGPGPTTTPTAPPPATSTPLPTLTDTPLPPPTNTLPPPPTETVPPPTDTQPPPPTDTEPPPTATDPPIQVLETTPTPSP